MRIIHRVAINSTPQTRRELAALGLVIGRGDPVASGVVAFEIDEGFARWSDIQAWMVKRKASDLVYTKFSKEEIAASRWLELQADWHHGYPQPDEDNFGYREATYDLTDFCEQCGIGKKQKAPFQMKSEPKWGRRGILQLNWVFDEFFATPNVWGAVFEPLGIGCRPVLNRKGVRLTTVVQLVAEAEVNVRTDDLAEQTCGKCARVKYAPVTRGAFPALMDEPSKPLVKTRQFFGSGGSAHKGVLISQRVARALAEKAVRGASVRPVAVPPLEEPKAC